MSEDRIQQECYIWFHNSYKELRGLLFHVPNGGLRKGREAAKFKAMGVVPGVADLIFLLEGKTYFIEMKDDKGRQSDSQKLWERKVLEHGFEYHVARSLDDFKKIIKTILGEY